MFISLTLEESKVVMSWCPSVLPVCHLPSDLRLAVGMLSVNTTTNMCWCVCRAGCSLFALVSSWPMNIDRGHVKYGGGTLR